MISLKTARTYKITPLGIPIIVILAVLCSIITPPIQANAWWNAPAANSDTFCQYAIPSDWQTILTNNYGYDSSTMDIYSGCTYNSGRDWAFVFGQKLYLNIGGAWPWQETISNPVKENIVWNNSENTGVKIIYKNNFNGQWQDKSTSVIATSTYNGDSWSGLTDLLFGPQLPRMTSGSSTFDLLNVFNLTDLSAYQTNLTAPSAVYYPNRPVISYSIKGKTLDLDCHLSTFFAPNDASFTNCQFFIDKDSGDTDNLNLTQFTGTNATATITNMLNLNVISDNHIANMTTCFDSEICPTEEQTHFQYTFEDYGKYYVKLAIQNDTEDGYISAVDRTIVIDGTNFEGDTENGTVIPDIYETCPDFLTDAGGFITCTIKNFGTSIITAISDFFTFLFTPTTPIADLWSDFFDTLSEKLGFLSYPFTFIGSLATSISNATTADCTLSFGTILDGQSVSYDFCQFEDNLPTFFDFFQMILIGGTTLLLISGLMGKFKEITST